MFFDAGTLLRCENWVCYNECNIKANDTNTLNNGQYSGGSNLNISNIHVVPVINLTQDTVMSMTGSGTKTNPFEA